MIIFLDANIIIYQVEAVPSFRDKAHAAIAAILAKEPDCHFAVSRLSLLECLVKPTRERNGPLVERYRSFFTTSDLTIVEITPQVIDRALQLRADIGLRTPDAIQAASALVLPEPTSLVTGDAKFSKVPGLSSLILV